MKAASFAARLATAFLLVGVVVAPGNAAEADAPSVCRKLEHEGGGYAVCTVDLRRLSLQLFWKGSDGQPYASLSRLADAQGSAVVAATNAGMYDPDLAPVGLYVENGRELKRANTAGGEGNFHLKPNGVFYVAKGQAGILETGEYLRRKVRPDLATQSGPMLVIDGRLHPQISDDGPSKKLRNGVGVRDGHTVVLAISDGAVSFGTFARLFRDALGCRDALFLDGSISGLYAPGIGRRDITLKPIGPILAVVARRTGRVPAGAR